MGMLELSNEYPTKDYGGPGKTKFRNIVIESFEKDVLTLCLESEQLRFVDALPNCQHIVYERNKDVYNKLKNSRRKNIKVFYGDISEAIALKPLGVKFTQAFLDFMGTYDTLEPTLKVMEPLLSRCQTVALTFSMRSPSKGKTITLQSFRIAIGLKNIFPLFDIICAETYADGAAMLGLILKKGDLHPLIKQQMERKAQSDADRVRTRLWRKIKEQATNEARPT